MVLLAFMICDAGLRALNELYHPAACACMLAWSVPVCLIMLDCVMSWQYIASTGCLTLATLLLFSVALQYWLHPKR